MRIFREVDAIRNEVKSLRKSGKTVSLVPTMGYLHEGHMSLIKIAQSHGDAVFASIFVNPLQFNDKQDFLKYPVDLERDCKLLDEASVHGVLVPTVELFYPEGHQSRIYLSKLPTLWEGASRPGHFEGVTTVVSMLFNIVSPDFAVFGEKDFQQLRIIEQMVSDLRIDVKIVRGPTFREPDGLAMSSRNVRLSKEGRAKAPLIFKSLSKAAEFFKGGCIEASTLRQCVISSLSEDQSFNIDYVAIVREDTLEEVQSVEGNCRILIAVTLEGIRLIDNLALVR